MHWRSNVTNLSFVKFFYFLIVVCLLFSKIVFDTLTSTLTSNQLSKKSRENSLWLSLHAKLIPNHLLGTKDLRPKQFHWLDNTFSPPIRTIWGENKLGWNDKIYYVVYIRIRTLQLNVFFPVSLILIQWIPLTEIWNGTFLQLIQQPLNHQEIWEAINLCVLHFHLSLGGICTHNLTFILPNQLLLWTFSYLPFIFESQGLVLGRHKPL